MSLLRKNTSSSSAGAGGAEGPDAETLVDRAARSGENIELVNRASPSLHESTS